MYTYNNQFIGIFFLELSQIRDNVNAIDATIKLGGENYVFWGGREGYQSIYNTDMKRELDHLGQFFHMAVDYAKEIGFTGQFLIEPKPKEPTKHQYDSDAAACLNFLRAYDLLDYFKLNIETNHATLAGHSSAHDLQMAADAGAVNGTAFSAVENLVAGDLGDTFTFGGALSGTAEGGAGDDTFTLNAGGSANLIDGDCKRGIGVDLDVGSVGTLSSRHDFVPGQAIVSFREVEASTERAMAMGMTLSGGGNNREMLLTFDETDTQAEVYRALGVNGRPDSPHASVEESMARKLNTLNIIKSLRKGRMSDPLIPTTFSSIAKQCPTTSIIPFNGIIPRSTCPWPGTTCRTIPARARSWRSPIPRRRRW